MMVALVIAMVVAALGYVVYRKRLMATGAGAAAAPVKVPDVTENYGGMSFVVKPGTDAQTAINQGATAYDINDPNTALRTTEAIARADKLTTIASAKGQTVDAMFAAREAASVAAGKAQAAAITQYSAAHGGFVPKTNADLYQAESAQIPIMGAQPPGTYWNYSTQKWEPLFF